MASDRCALESKGATKKGSSEIFVQFRKKPVYLGNWEAHPEIFPIWQNGLTAVLPHVDRDDTHSSGQKDAGSGMKKQQVLTLIEGKEQR